MKAKLHSDLEKLRLALKEQEQTDPARSAAAERLRREIDDFLQSVPDTSESEHNSMLESLKTSIEQFEASHPTLGLMIEKFLDTLSNLGI